MRKKDENKEVPLEELEAASPEAEQAEQSETPEPAPEKSEAELLCEQLAEQNDKYLRLLAEYDNFRKRSIKERDELYPAATASAVAKFLPVLDNFERAAAFPHGDDEFGKGFDMILKSFREVLDGLGVEAVGTVGEPFDPAFHNAVMHIEDEGLGENVVSQVLQKGYKIGGRIIRYAMVQTAN